MTTPPIAVFPSPHDFDDTAATPVGGGNDADERAGRTITANLVHAPVKPAARVLVGAAVMLLLLIVPGYLVLRADSRNPAADQLNALSVPGWAGSHAKTHTSGSRYCVGQCMVTERTWESSKPIKETAAVYAVALRKQGWRPAPSCPKYPDGVQTCWVLDQNELDLTVGPAPCVLAPPPTNISGVIEGEPVGPSKPPSGCSPTTVHAKVTDQVNIATKS